jgi:hypothetical protein
MYGGESHRELVEFFLVLTPNILIVAVIFAWLITAFEVQKNRVPWHHWAVLILVTLLLPQLKDTWLQRPLVRYLPTPFLHFPSSWPVNIFFILLPAIVASSAIFARRRLSSYVLLAGGAIYILLVAVIIILFNGGAMA